MNQNTYASIAEQAIQEGINVRSIKEGWNQIKKGKYLTLYNMKYKNNDHKLIKVEGVIPVNYEKTAKYIFEDNEGQQKVRDNIENIQIIEKINQDMHVHLVKFKSVLIVSAREVLAVQHQKRLSQNEIVVVRGNLEDHQKVPKKNDVVRCEGKVFAIFTTKISEQQTRFEAFLLMDPKGSIPAMVVNHAIENVLNEFEEDVQNIMKL